MPLRLLAIAVAALVLGATVASARAPVRYCGWVHPSHADAAMVKQVDTTCAIARRVIRFYGNFLREPAGWRCHDGAYPDAVLVCTRGRARVIASVLP